MTEKPKEKRRNSLSKSGDKTRKKKAYEYIWKLSGTL
jgi:hypothetical protein